MEHRSQAPAIRILRLAVAMALSKAVWSQTLQFDCADCPGLATPIKHNPGRLEQVDQIRFGQ